MAFIGNTNTTQAFTPAIDYFNGDGTTTAFTLSRPVASVAQVQVVVNNVPQLPGTAFTVSSNTITFTGAPSAGTNNIYVYYTSPITQVIAPSQGTVGTTQLAGGTVNTSADITANGLTVGKGGGTVSTNTAVGVSALNATNTGGLSTCVGYNAGSSLTSGDSNNFVGAYAGRITTTGLGNVGIGTSVLYDNVSGSSNIAIGQQALRYNTASNNTAVGYQAGYTNSTGPHNTFVGTQAGYSSTGGENTCVGRTAGYSISTGTGNTFVGPGNGATSNGAGYYVTTGSKNSILGGYNGNQGGLDIRTSSNYIVLSDGDGNPNFYINNSSQSFTSCSVGDFIQKWSLGTTSTDGLVVTYPTVTPNNTSRFFFRGSDATNTKIDIYSSGTISNRTGTYNTLSDAKLKENIVDATPKLNKLMNVKVRNYNLIGDELKQIGFVAQELEQVFPNLIDNVPDFDENRELTGEVTKGVKLTVMIPILVKAIQELKAIVDAQAVEIAELKAQK